jgi:plastocyanin
MPARRPSALWSVALTVAVPVLLLASCSSGKPTPKASAVGGVQQITISTGADRRFHPSTFTVHPGKVRIVLTNKPPPAGGAPHTLKVNAFAPGFVPETPAGQSNSVTFTAPSPGRYSFVCTIHAAQGQTGTMIVTGAAASS